MIKSQISTFLQSINSLDTISVTWLATFSSVASSSSLCVLSCLFNQYLMILHHGFHSYGEKRKRDNLMEICKCRKARYLGRKHFDANVQLLVSFYVLSCPSSSDVPSR